ncbi:hypothetical protein B0A48_18594 [Cryoendolithus antarcticus]|uniref:Uncharacterized protein n=1 Tax=Cryoendolithus antarcticus TaxID=1507870 RepID=A0A1V8S861_9PEZI|nr:hypothetical protein B0A48_18594 [Cryoendolithus antarcticus]
MVGVRQQLAHEFGLVTEKKPKPIVRAEDEFQLLKTLWSCPSLTFDHERLRVQLALIAQLAGITGNRPGALLVLCNEDLKVTLLPDPEGAGVPRVIRKFSGSSALDGLHILEGLNQLELPIKESLRGPPVFRMGLASQVAIIKAASGTTRKIDRRQLNALNRQQLEGVDRHPEVRLLARRRGALATSTRAAYITITRTKGTALYEDYHDARKVYLKRNKALYIEQQLNGDYDGAECSREAITDIEASSTPYILSLERQAALVALFTAGLDLSGLNLRDSESDRDGSSSDDQDDDDDDDDNVGANAVLTPANGKALMIEALKRLMAKEFTKEQAIERYRGHLATKA